VKFSKNRKQSSNNKNQDDAAGATTEAPSGDKRQPQPGVIPLEVAAAPSIQAAPGEAEQNCRALAQEVLAGQAGFAQILKETTGQAALQRQQLGQVYTAVGQLYQAVSAQCQQLLQSDTALQQELSKFQTGGPQRAMAGVFAKLFRDLIKHANELDELVMRNETQSLDAAAQSWFEALRIMRNQYEVLLKDWGCTPMPIQVGVEEFDPERHEAIAAEPGDVPEGAPAHTIVRVRRRGWIMNEQILQYPQVVVS